MVNLDVVRAQNAELVRSRPLVAVFTGATSGIGLSTLYNLCKTHSTTGRGLRVYFAGRNVETAANIIAKCRSLCPPGDFRFLQTNDLALLSEVDRICDEIVVQERTHSSSHGGEEPRVDLLVMSQGELSFKPRTETREGLEFRVSLLYYSRMKTILNLLPLLTARSPISEDGSPPPAHIISVFAAGLEGNLYLDDISLRDPKHWGIIGTRSHVTYMKTFFFEHLASEYTGKLSLVHVFPGLILTEGFKKLPLWLQWISRLVSPVLRLFLTSVEEAGERVLFLASTPRFPAKDTVVIRGKADGLEVARGTDLELGSGAYGVSLDGEVTPEARMRKVYDGIRADSVGEKLVAHTMKVFEEIKAGMVFKD